MEVSQEHWRTDETDSHLERCRSERYHQVVGQRQLLGNPPSTPGHRPDMPPPPWQSLSKPLFSQRPGRGAAEARGTGG